MTNANTKNAPVLRGLMQSLENAIAVSAAVADNAMDDQDRISLQMYMQLAGQLAAIQKNLVKARLIS